MSASHSPGSRVKAEEFLDLVKKSGLVEEERLNSCLSALEPAAYQSGVVCSSLIRAGLLTEWQAEKLLEGKTRGFFLGKYKLLSHLGSGGMGKVYLAEHSLMRRRVAIKVLAGQRHRSDMYVQRFVNEARVVAKLDHPNVVRAHDIDSDENDRHYLVMEYVEGIDLHFLVQRDGPLPVPLALDYIRQAAEGLQHAHEHGLVHRDIKPANLLLDTKGTIKITDLGLARFLESEDAPLTVQGEQNLVGTVDFMAPEQAINSHDADFHADIYSLGCTFYYLLTGNAPFPGGSLPQRVMQHQMAPPPDLRKHRADVPVAVADLYRRMLAKKPAERQASCRALAEEIQAYLSSASSTSSPAAEGQPPSSAGDELTLATAPTSEDAAPSPERRPGGSSPAAPKAAPRTPPPEKRVPQRQAPSNSRGNAARRPTSPPSPGPASPMPPAAPTPVPNAGWSAASPAAARGYSPTGDLFSSTGDLLGALAGQPLVAADSLSGLALPPVGGGGFEPAPFASNIEGLAGGTFASQAPFAAPAPSHPAKKGGKKKPAPRTSENGIDYPLWLLIGAGVLIGMVIVAVGISWAISTHREEEPRSIQRRSTDE